MSNLPSNWRIRHGKYTYRVPRSLQARLGAVEITLGKTYEEALLKFENLTADRTLQRDEKLLSLSEIGSLPRGPGGVYFLFNEADQLIYVGQSANIWRRLLGHQSKGKVEYSTVRALRRR